MTERIVQWALLREWDYLQVCLSFPIRRHYGENITTECGVLDFVLLTADPKHPLVIVELKTAIDTKSKLVSLQDQLQIYSHVKFPPYKNSPLVLLYAEDVMPPKWERKVLTNEVMRPCKANIYYFLHVTESAWVPKPTAREPQPGEEGFDYWHLATALFGKRYAWCTLTDFLAFTCNQCEELELVDRLRFQGSMTV